MSRYLNSLEWGEPVLCPPRGAAVDGLGRRRSGLVPTVVLHAASVPWVADTLADGFRLDYAHLSRDELGLALFAATRESSCRYCYGSVRAMVGMLGWSGEQIDRMESRLELEELGARSVAIVTFARRLTLCAPFPDATDLARLEAVGLGRGAIGELAYFIGVESFATRVATALAVPPDARAESLPGSLPGRLFRPLLARLLWRHPTPRSPPADAGTDAFAPLVRALDRSPVAAKLRQALDAAFGAGGLVAGERARIVGRVASALGSPAAVSLARSRMIAAAAPHEPDDAHARVVAFAGDTASLRPVALQHRMRVLVDSLGERTALDVLGTAALGHLIARTAWLLGSAGEPLS